MAFKVASAKAQAALRRILPSFLSDYRENLTPQQKYECLDAARVKLISDNAVLKLATNKQQRFEYAQNILTIKSLWKEMEIIALELKEERKIIHESRMKEQEIKSEIIRKQKAKIQGYRDRICLDVIKDWGINSKRKVA